MLKNYLFKKDCGAKELIVEIGLVVVGVFLIVAFRSEIKGILDSVMGTAKTTITGLFS